VSRPGSGSLMLFEMRFRKNVATRRDLLEALVFRNYILPEPMSRLIRETK